MNNIVYTETKTYNIQFQADRGMAINYVQLEIRDNQIRFFAPSVVTTDIQEIRDLRDALSQLLDIYATLPLEQPK